MSEPSRSFSAPTRDEKPDLPISDGFLCLERGTHLLLHQHSHSPILAPAVMESKSWRPGGTFSERLRVTDAPLGVAVGVRSAFMELSPDAFSIYQQSRGPRSVRLWPNKSQHPDLGEVSVPRHDRPVTAPVGPIVLPSMITTIGDLGRFAKELWGRSEGWWVLGDYLAVSLRAESRPLGPQVVSACQGPHFLHLCPQ